MSTYPPVKDAQLVGTYPAAAKADGGDYYYAYETYEEALAFSKTMAGTEEPLALVLQEEYIVEPEPGQYVHIKEQRVTEWPVEFLRRPKRNENTIPDFLASDAPENRLDILRGLA
jgi:hypothetical protein